MVKSEPPKSRLWSALKSSNMAMESHPPHVDSSWKKWGFTSAIFAMLDRQKVNTNGPPLGEGGALATFGGDGEAGCEECQGQGGAWWGMLGGGWGGWVFLNWPPSRIWNI